MDTRFVGWIRTHWYHWEPIIWGDDDVAVWKVLCAVQTPDEDGERVVLPRGERPVPIRKADQPST